MRTFPATATAGDEDAKRVPSGIARASAAAAHDLITRRAQRMRHRSRGAWLAVIGAAFAMAAAGAHADSIKIGGTGTGLGTMKLLAQAFKLARPDAQLIITPSLGSTGAIRAVLAGAVDIGVSARPVTPEESSKGASAQAYAKTPFVIATGAKNPSAGLTLHQLAQMYSGQITHWPDGSMIRLVIRPDTDADTILMKTFSAEMNTAITAAHARKGLRMAETDQDNADALEQLPGSLGATTLTLISTEKRAIKPLALDGVSPTLQSLTAGRYRYARTLYLITGRNPSPLAKDFVAFVRSSAGQAILTTGENLAVQE